MLISVRRLKVVILVFLLLVITFVAFSPALKNAFNYDDDIYIKENRFIKSLSLYNVERIFTSFFAGHYQPVSILTYLFEYRFFGLNPHPYHLTNILFHSFNCLLVFWLFYLIGGRVLSAWIIAVLFVVHPLRVESVVWISERKDIAYAFFFLGACIAYLYYLKNKENKKFYYLAIIAFILSLLSKSMAVTLPFILLLLDYLIKRKPSKTMFIDKIPFFCLSLVSCFIVVFGLIIIGGVRLEPHYGLFSTLATASYGITFYLTKTLFPLNLSCLYPYNNFEYNPVYLYSIITVIILFIVVFVSLRYTKKLLFGAAFFLITLLPVLQFIPNSSIIVADRYTYIPSIGIFFIFSTLIYWVYSKISKQGIIKAILVIILTCIIGILSILTYNRCKVWYDGITLWSDVLKKYPNFVTALNNRGNLFAMNNEHDSALIDFKKAVSIKSEYKESRNAYLSLANLYRQTGEIDEAIIVLQEALNKSPNDAEIFYNLGIVYSFMNKGTAVAYYKKAIKLNPLHTATYYNLGSLYIELGDREGAITMLKKAIKINPDFTIAYAQLAKLYNNPARKEELVYLYKEAIRRNLDFFDAYYYIGNLYQESGRDREAMVLYKRALQIDPKR